MKDHFINLMTDKISANEAKEILGHLTLFENVKEFQFGKMCNTNMACT